MSDTLHLQQLKSFELFRKLNEEELLDLYASMDKVNVKAGEILITQGEISNSMYILMSGKLLVKTSDGKVVGQISRGQTVGEMGLIVQEPRSATVVALRDSSLLKLNNESFNQVWEKRPSVLLEVTKMITHRLQRALKSSQYYNHVSNIVIFPGHRDVDIKLFIEQLSASFDSKFQYKILKRCDFPSSVSAADLYAAIHEIENQYDYLFYLVEEDLEWQEICFERADQIYVVVNAHQHAVFDSDVLAILKSYDAESNIRTVLVLMHDVWGPPSNTSNWLVQTHFTQHHHLCFHHKDDFARLLRFVNGSVVGLVLGGGGTRIWAQAGVVKYLFEEGITIDAYAGTSAGAMSAAVLSVARDYQDVLEASQSISRMMRFNEYTIPLVSLLSSKSLTNVLKTLFGEIKIEDLRKMLFCVASDLVSSSEIDICEGPLWRAVRASAAIPGIYPPVYGNGRLLVDGGVVNNLPVDVMRNYFDGMGKIIAIDISAALEVSMEYDYPLDLGWWWILRNKFFSSDREFKLPAITGTLMKALMLTSIKKSKLNIQLSDVCICPALSGYGLLDVSKKEKMFEIGYAAAQESLKNWHQNVEY